MRWRLLLVVLLLGLPLVLGACAPQTAQRAEIVLPKDCVVTNLHLEVVSTTEIVSLKMNDVFWHVMRMNWNYADPETFIVQGPAEVKPKSAMHEGRIDSGYPEGLVACQTEQSAKDYMKALLGR